MLSTSGDPYNDRAWKGGERMLVVPLYSLRVPQTGEWRCTRNFVLNTINYRYSSVFFLPGSTDHGLLDSVVRFDRVMGMHISWLIERRSAQLTTEAMRCVDEWFQFFVTGKIRKKFLEDVEAYRSLVAETPGTIETLFPPKRA